MECPGGHQDVLAAPWKMDLKASIFQVLMGGRESAIRLETLLQPDTTKIGSSGSQVEALVKHVLSSFSKAISFLELDLAEGMVLDLDLATTATPHEQQHMADAPSAKRRNIHQPRRSGYRRRAHPYTCTRILSETTEDGHTWRKYGQKDILSSKFPRSYFRCTHKYDRDCGATRQVQRSEYDPSLFVITYMGEHTCMDAATKLPGQSSPCVIDFGSNTCAAIASTDQGEKPLTTSLVPSLMKQEFKEEEEEEVSNLSRSSSSPAELEFPELSELECSASAVHLVGGGVLDHCDVTSSFHSNYWSFNLGFDAEALELDDALNFLFSQGGEGELY